jgi:hypothetical protein
VGCADRAAGGVTDPPPDVVAPEHRWIWYAACKLLEDNAGLTILSKSTDPSDNSDDECENTGYGAGA